MEPHLIQPFLMARRAAIDTVGGYRHVIYAEDSDLCWRMQELGRLHNLDEVLGDYRIHSGSISGRSLVNARVMAVSSQLAAISALRRRSGRPDLAFPKEMGARYAAATLPARIVALGSEGLAQEEIEHLEIAVAAKLMELAAYRPYELELADCNFIRSSLRKHTHRLSPANRAALRRSCAGTAARLLQQGLFREAAALVSPAELLPMLWRLGARLVVPRSARERLRNAIGRGSTVDLK
jgi:hypothetical protein